MSEAGFGVAQDEAARRFVRPIPIEAMQMLNNREINSIRRALPLDSPATESMVVIDLRNAQWQLNQIYFRNWAPSGVVCRTSPFEPDEIDRWLFQVQGKRSIVVLGNTGLDPSAQWLWKLASGDWFVQLDWPIIEPAVTFTIPETHYGPQHFTIEGLNAFDLTTQKLPVRFTARLSADTFRNVLSVKAKSEHSGLPREGWFKLASSLGSVLDRFVLTVDIELGHAEDVWTLNSEKIQVTEIRIPPAVELGGLDSVTVVFDRTCPQSGNWSSAKRLVTSRDDKVKEKEPVFGGMTEETSSDQLEPRDYNLAIRKSLASELDSFVRGDNRSQTCMINAIWFADDPSNLSWPNSGLTRPTSVGEWRSDIPLEELHDHFAQYTYTLGLDLWDSLDLAMTDVIRYLKFGRVHKAGVIIIGNSPPPPPTNPQSAYWRLLKADPSRHVDQLDAATFTSTARRTSRFTEQIQELAKIGIPCVYIFLEHGSAQNRDDELAFSFFRKLQQLVAEALGESLPVFRCPASSDGIKKGMKLALEFLGDSRKSAVRVERENV